MVGFMTAPLAKKLKVPIKARLRTMRAAVRSGSWCADVHELYFSVGGS